MCLAYTTRSPSPPGDTAYFLYDAGGTIGFGFHDVQISKLAIAALAFLSPRQDGGSNFRLNTGRGRERGRPNNCGTY